MYFSFFSAFLAYCCFQFYSVILSKIFDLKFPDGVDPWTDITVLPSQVNGSLVKVLGTSESFNVTWEPITNVNYGTVFYEVLIDSSVSK